ncbi:MAG TPA: DUF2846 domain-containing protein [Terracidiphilus sp.]|nr:DUF2846 domain-containing protein [Terracidiphilus sp.]
MRFALVALILAVAPVFAQNPAPACGPAGTDFKVSFDKAPHAVAQPESGMARIYFIHDTGTFFQHPFGYPTVKVGVDGAWSGANHGDSFFWADVPPGEHHICATLQTSVMDRRVELAHLNAEPGKTYFFRTRLLLSGTVEVLELDPIDSDQGAYLVSQFALSLSKPKK